MKYVPLTITAIALLILGGLSAYATWQVYGWTFVIVAGITSGLHYVACYFAFATPKDSK